jgi:tetratricopeptide (TPR) repeat protein
MKHKIESWMISVMVIFLLCGLVAASVRIYQADLERQETSPEEIDAKARLQEYDTIILLEPDNADVYVSRGIVKATLKQYDAAIVDYDTAIQLNPDDALAYLHRGATKFEWGKRTRDAHRNLASLDDYETALALAEKADDTELTDLISQIGSEVWGWEN